MRFSLESPVAEPVRLQIIDVTGRSLREEVLPPASGSRTWFWDGLDDSGRRVPPGQYRVRAVAPSGGGSRAFVLVH
jgi:flagellar hook assembly protein FlgD